MDSRLRGNDSVACEGGSVAGNARKEIEVKTGRKVVLEKSAKEIGLIKNPRLLEDKSF